MFVFFASGIVFYLFTFDINLFVLLVLLLIFQLLSTVIVTVSDSLATDVASRTSKVGDMTAYTVAVDVGAALGPLFGYVIVDFLSMEVLYRLTAGLLIFIGFLWMIKMNRKAN